MFLIFARKDLNKKSETTMNDDVQKTASTVVNDMEKQDIKRRINVWEMPVG